MNNGFVYILLNPAFPKLIKIGETSRTSVIRAIELSRQTGVPEDYIVLYDELVSERKKVEKILHEDFAAYRSTRNKEFFNIAPKEAIKALQELALKFPTTSMHCMSSDLTPYFRKNFSEYIDPRIQKINLVMLPSVTYLEVERLRQSDSHIITEQDDIPLSKIIESEAPNVKELKKNESLLKSCDAYDWIMISNLFTEEECYKIAEEWESPDSKLNQKKKV